MRILHDDERAFTLAEVLTAMAASVLIVGALLLGSISLHRSLSASEKFATWQSDQRRLIDYVTRELRRAVSIAATDEAGTPHLALAGDSIAVEDRASLVVTLPAYYQSEVPEEKRFDKPLDPVMTNDGIGYGNESGASSGVAVSFRKIFVAAEGSVCFVRQEADALQVIVRDADNLYFRVRITPDGNFCDVEAWFRSAYTGIRPVVSTKDRVMLRNLRVDTPL